MCVLGAVALVLVALASLLAGTAALGTREALQALATLASGGTADATATLVLLSVRLPRVLAGVCCGAALACSGLLLQASLDNDLASPGVMGVNSGAGLLWLVAALWMPGHPVLRQAMAFVGALLATLLVYLVSRRAGTSRGTVVLAGVAVSSLMSAAIDAIVVVWPESVTDRVSFTLGGLSGVTYQSLALCVPALLVALVAGAYLGRGIDLLGAGGRGRARPWPRRTRLQTWHHPLRGASDRLGRLDLRPSQLCGPHRPQPGAHVGAPHNSSGARSLRPVGSCALGCVRPRGADHCVSL